MIKKVLATIALAAASFSASAGVTTDTIDVQWFWDTTPHYFNFGNIPSPMTPTYIPSVRANFEAKHGTFGLAQLNAIYVDGVEIIPDEVSLRGTSIDVFWSNFNVNSFNGSSTRTPAPGEVDAKPHGDRLSNFRLNWSEDHIFGNLFLIMPDTGWWAFNGDHQQIYTIDYATNPPYSGVPLPGTAALLGLAMVGWGVPRLRRLYK